MTGLVNKFHKLSNCLKSLHICEIVKKKITSFTKVHYVLTQVTRHKWKSIGHLLDT